MVTPTTARKEELIRKDMAHFIHPVSTVGDRTKIIWEKGEGAKIWDIDGKQYIDITSGGVHCNNLGYARKELIDAAHEQMQTMTHIFAGATSSTIPAIEYAAELAEVLPGDINHVYLTNTGTQSNEIAVQVARFYWEARGKLDKFKIICLTHSYHGGSVLTRSLSHYGMSCFDRRHPGIVSLPNYHCHLCPYGLKYPSCDILCARMLERMIDDEGEDTVAAFIAEPVQGAAGLIWPPDEYIPIVRDICSRRNIIYINDEVMAGFARTGKMFAIELWNVVPDIISMAKGINSSYLPFGAVGVSDRLFKDVGGRYFMGVSTSDANSVCVATARAALKIFKEEKLAERSAKLGEHLHERLVKEFLPLPCVDDILGKGLFQSFEIALNKTTGSEYNPEAAAKARESILSKLLEKGVYATRYDGYPRRQPIGPPCVITEDELDKALDAMLSVMKEIKPV